MAELVDPLQLALQNFSTFQDIENQQQQAELNTAKLAQQAESKKQGLAMQNDLALLAENPNAGAKDYIGMMLKYPTMSEHFKKTFDLMDSANQKSSQSRAINLLNMLRSGQTGFAEEALEEQQLAAENAGRTDDARGAEAMLEIVRTNPQAAEAAVTLSLAGTMGADEFGGVYDKISANIREASGKVDVQSSKILPGGLVQIVRKDGTVETIEPLEANKVLIEAAEERGAELQGLRAGERGSAKESMKIGIDSFKQIITVRKNIDVLNEGIELLKTGAKTGAVEGRFPSIRAASVKLDNLQNRLGLQVVSSITFGALSEKELALAKETALPKGLDEPELIKWMEDKRNAQLKVVSNLEEAAQFLSEPGNSVADFIKIKKAEKADAEAKAKAEEEVVTPEVQPTPTTDLTQMTDEQLAAEIARLQGQ